MRTDMATSSTPITGLNAGDTVYGEIDIVADADEAGTFTVISTATGQTTTPRSSALRRAGQRLQREPGRDVH
jgi:hypothetical protein